MTESTATAAPEVVMSLPPPSLEAVVQHLQIENMLLRQHIAYQNALLFSLQAEAIRAHAAERAPEAAPVSCWPEMAGWKEVVAEASSRQ